MNGIFVLSSTKEPLMPTSPARARLLLKRGKAAIFRRYPFTIILKERSTGETQPLQLKLDPGSKITGGAIVRGDGKALFGFEIKHRGQQIKNDLDSRRAIRRNRRNRHTRYRQPRFDNRTRPKGWLPPSIMSRVRNIKTWVDRICRWAPITGLSMELVRFDLQKLENPEISGVEYQQGTLFGFEVKEYLLLKWGHRCAYCGEKDTPLEVEHVIARTNGGSDRVSNLTIACRDCNEKKGKLPIETFLKNKPEVLKRIKAQLKAPLKDAAAVNATRWCLLQVLRETGLEVETGSGGLTKWNRTRLGYPKEHWIDAACVGLSGARVDVGSISPLTIKATGHGNRQMCGTDRFGFPTRHRSNQRTIHGFRTGDLVVARVPSGKKAGTHTGRVSVRKSGSFDIQSTAGRVQGISHKYIQPIQRRDGYAYG